jgi:hypothetical protein
MSRWLARLYSAQFRHEYGDAFAEVAEDRWRRERRAGASGIKATWVTAQVLISDTLSAARQGTRRSSERRFVMFDRLAGHVRFAVRSLWREPFFLWSAALTLAVGVSGLAVTGGFADAILLQRITQVAPDRVFFVSAVDDQGHDSLSFSAPEVESLERYLNRPALVASVSLQSALVRAGDTTVQSLAEVTSGDFSHVLPVQPVIGRLLTDAEISQTRHRSRS